MRGLMILIVTIVFYWGSFDIVLAGDMAGTDIMQVVMEGQNLTERDAVRLEETFKKTPDDLEARAILLGYYFGKQYADEEVRQARYLHVIWLIEKHPGSYLAGLPYAGLNSHLDSENFSRAKKLWLKQVADNEKDTAILKNAANFMYSDEKDEAKKLLEKGKALTPDDAHWDEQLGRLLASEAKYHRGSIEDKKELASQALGHFEAALGKMNEQHRFYNLNEAAESALLAGQEEKAASYAAELLSLADKYPKNWNYGNALHHGHIILGKLAFSKGEMKEARQHLLEAGKTPGSPQLNSFGPDFSLAESLLDKGERKTVVKYLEACSTFWESGQECLQKWIVLIKDKLKPSFKKHGC